MADTGTKHMPDSIELPKSKAKEVSFKYTIGDVGATKGTGDQLTLQEAFKRYRQTRQEEVRKARRLRKRWKARQRDPKRMALLREKFIKQATKYFGYPYAKKYWAPGSPEYKSRLFLDCCGLVRQVMRDLQDDFGFVLGGGNQAYMYDTLPIIVERERDMKPGDLVFMSGTYTNPKTKKQRHNMTHVEIWLGDGNKTIGARWNNGKVQVWDNYKFSAKSFHSETYHFRSIDSWLKGKCVSHCPKHSWKRAVYNPSKKSIFNPEQDIQQDEAAGDADDDNSQFQDLYVQGYNLPITDTNQASDEATEFSNSLAEVKDEVNAMKAQVELTLSNLEPSDTVMVCSDIEDMHEMDDNQDDTDGSPNELNDSSSELSDDDVGEDIAEHSTLVDKFSKIRLDGRNDREPSTIMDKPKDSLYLSPKKDIERQESFLGINKRASAVKQINKMKSGENTELLTGCTFSTTLNHHSEMQKIPNVVFCTMSGTGKEETLMNISKPVIKSSIFNGNSCNKKSNTVSQKAENHSKDRELGRNQNAKPNTFEKDRNRNVRPKTLQSRGNTSDDMCKTYHDQNLSCPDEYNEGQSSRPSSSLSDEPLKGIMKRLQSAGSDDGCSDSLEAQTEHQGAC